LQTKEERQMKIDMWKEENQEHIKEYRKDYYLKSLEVPSQNSQNEQEPIEVLRECLCGVAAITKEDLRFFVSDPYSKWGYRNKCLDCAARTARKGKDKVPPHKTCKKCLRVVEGTLQIGKAFRQTKATGGKTYGELTDVCKKCEFPKDQYYEIDGKFIPVNIEHKNLHNKPLEAL